MKLLHQLDRMTDPVEKIWVAERNMAGAGGDLTPHVFHHDIPCNDAERAFVNRHNRTVPAQVLAAAARLGRADHTVAAIGQNKVCVFFHWGQTGTLGNSKRETIH